MTKNQNLPENENGVLLHLEDVWKIYQMGEIEVPALKGVTVEIKKSDFVAIIGASGSGKSTMMNLIGCLDIPSKGRILLKDQDISQLSESDLATFRGKTIGFIFQQYNLIPTMTAFENVMLPLEFQEIDDKIASKRAKEILAFLGLADKIHHRPSQLSGGQQQRVSIARCLVTDPEIILADEPTGALDSVTGKNIIEMLHRFWREEGKTIIMVTHDQNLAKYANTTIELKDGEIIRIQENAHEILRMTCSKNESTPCRLSQN
ncbi:MAG: ABC transporter ATP-binding protein [ANME-2 cluster archaeon]|nr:ABC transporter ATP-binding protein [ANME-2 cluster archaeon]MBC2702556.1 ABC transporter ATP-binding protein [ANME-2 cluster archaeon]